MILWTSMRVFVIITIAHLSTAIEASRLVDTSMNCSAIWEENKHQLSNAGGPIRLTMLHHQHPCSPVRHGEGFPSFSWHRSRALERERHLAARLFFRRRPAAPTNISVPVTINRPLYGFVAQVTLGTPATTQSVLIDSAATYSWVQCAACAGSRSGCFRQDDQLFNPGGSTTYRRLPCSSPYCLSATGNPDAPALCAGKDVYSYTCMYAVDYIDGSSSVGLVGTDKLTFGEETFPGFVFGCSQGYDGMFGRYSGIFSFGNAKMSFFSQVVERTRQYRAFSYYLPSPSSVGYIQVGAYDEDGLAFTPMFTNGTDYYIALTGITVDGCPLDMAPARRFSPKTAVAIAACYLDLGATLSVLPRLLFEKLDDAVAKRIKGYDRVQSSWGCFYQESLSTERVIPVVQLFSHGVRLVLDENKLMSRKLDGRLCLGFVPSDFCILGSMQMQMIYAAQDVDKSRMGFSSSY